MNIKIFPNPIDCAGVPGGVNSVVTDHAVGFLAAGLSINENKGPTIVHALAQSAQIDVFHCHGLYPIGLGHFDAKYSRANDIILQNALRAKVTVCISEFSANILRHKLHIDPHVTRNGIWINEYAQGGSPTGPVLFPKASLDANAKPDDMQWLRDNSDLKLLSIARIVGIPSTGPLSRSVFLSTLREASIYLGTTKENNSMASMEAMISGVPIVGYNMGFNSEWLINGVGCELVEPGDKNGLREAIYKVKGNWLSYSQAARSYAEIFNWQPVIDELIGLYERVDNTLERKEVSIIIPVHNYAKFLPEAIESALAQTVGCEVIVVDDKSTDDSLQIAKRYEPRVTVLRNEINLGVAETRNRGIQHAAGNYIVCLDADDRLRPHFVERHLAAFTTRDQAIAYAPINVIDQNGADRKQRLFRAVAQAGLQSAGRNQIPSACMFRKEFWSRAGGYDKHYTPAEDAQLWLKIFSLGGIPLLASKEPLMDYRTGHASLSTSGFPDWWSDNALNYHAPIAERDTTQITVILDSEENAKETLWSLENQSYLNWSCQLKAKNNLQKVFPWLNHTPTRSRSVLNIKAGTILPPNFLSEYMRQTPHWTREPRFLSQ